MGATVTTGKLAAAFARENGTIIYVLFEKTYEKNCYPHTPNWCCIAIGEYADVMRRVFGSAASCEGGGLQNTRGYIKPENYIEAWRRELAKPVRMGNVSIRLKIGGGIYGPIHQNDLEQVKTACIKVNRAEIYDAIEGGGVNVSLHEDVGLILALYGYKTGFMSPWRILNIGDSMSVPEPGLALETSNEAIPPLDAAIYRIDQEHRLVRLGCEPWHNGGYAYNVVGSFINEIAYVREMQHTGSAKHLIHEFRITCDTAKPVPADTLITVTRGVSGAEKWNMEKADELAGMLGFTNKPNMFTFTFAEVVAAKATDVLTYLNINQVQWEVPREDHLAESVYPVSCSSSQVSLL